MKAQRTHIAGHPFPPVDTGEPTEWMRRGQWPAFWIMPGERRETPFVVLYRHAFELPQTTTFRFHVSADERYSLWLDGKRIGRGPETSDYGAWCYDSYETELPAGRHEFVARVFSLGSFAIFPQVSIAHGFLLATEGDLSVTLNTGMADWVCAYAEAWSFHPNSAGATWACEEVRGGAGRPEDLETMRLAWVRATKGLRGRSRADASHEWVGDHPLCPSLLPPQFHRSWTFGRVVHAESRASAGTEIAGADAVAALRETCPGWRVGDVRPGDSTRTTPLDSTTANTEVGHAWQCCIDGAGTLTVPAHVWQRVVLDLGNYVCGYPEIRIEGGSGSVLHFGIHEALYRQDAEGNNCKESRDRVDGMVFLGAPDTFLPSGAVTTFETLWWRSGRYIELAIQTGAEPLTILEMVLQETRYPLETASRFECRHPGPAAFTPVAVRCMQMCAHETHMDCPYYEQQMWVGDMRVQVLTSYCMTTDDRLARKCIQMAAMSRRPGEATLCRWPVRQRMVIPSFSLWFISMVYDYALWRGNLNFVRGVMPDARATMDVMLQRQHPSGLYLVPQGWNYVDWCRWEFGSPSIDITRPTAVNNWQLVLVLRQLRELEAWLGEPELSTRWGRLAGALARRLDALCWDAGVGLYRDLLDEPQFSEHAQALAVLSGYMPEARRQSVRENIGRRDDRARASLYFQFYLFDMYRELGMAEELWAGLEPYFDMPANGHRTTPETFGNSRSDCHAWSAHPYYHFFTSILGIRPTAPGFAACRVDPMTGPLEWARGALAHPCGKVEVDVRGGVRKVAVPPGVVLTD